MTFEEKNQNNIFKSNLVNSFDIEYVFSNKPINRYKTKPVVENKVSLLSNLKKNIENVENCELKNHAKNLVFSDGNIESKLMMIKN